jgi:hypothetical protein
MGWFQFDDGSSIGQYGSEGGVIVLDEENKSGARITLERNGATAPFAITCGIYGWMVHTHFLENEERARQAFENMKIDLAGILDLVPASEDPDLRAKPGAVFQAIAGFVEKYQ